jgi:hypothetical protein
MLLNSEYLQIKEFTTCLIDTLPVASRRNLSPLYQLFLSDVLLDEIRNCSFLIERAAFPVLGLDGGAISL